MLTFKIINKDNIEEVLDGILLKMPDADAEYLGEIAASLLEDVECEYALSCSDGCLLIRFFDEKYFFAYPVALCDEADESIASYRIREYAVKEEIPLIFTDVPKEALGSILPLFRHANVDASDGEDECFTVKILSEADIMTEIPSLRVDGVELTELQESDDKPYARLCKDTETNVFWGYNYAEDEPNPADSYFREQAEGEFNRGISLSLAVRVNGEFAGEAILYSFDLIGGCECAVRILPEYRGQGVAAKALFGLSKIAREAGVINLFAIVDARNNASKKLCNKVFEESSKNEDKVKYYLKM